MRVTNTIFFFLLLYLNLILINLISLPGNMCNFPIKKNTLDRFDHVYFLNLIIWLHTNPIIAIIWKVKIIMKRILKKKTGFCGKKYSFVSFYYFWLKIDLVISEM